MQKTEIIDQKKLELKEDISEKVSGLVYKLRKTETLIEYTPFWRDAVVWFVISFSVFSYVLIYFYIRQYIAEMPPKIPFFYFYPEGIKQLIMPFELYYFALSSGILTLLNIIISGFLFSYDRNLGKLLLLIDLVKTILIIIILYKTVLIFT